MRISAAAILVSIVLSGEAYAALAEGEAALNQKDFVTAFTLLKPDAEAGNAQAQTYLGRMYRKGQGVAKDPSVAVTWFQKAATQGEWEASNTLGTMYRLGEGVPQDFQKAIQWYLEAAKLGVENAMYRVALMYQAGQGVQANPVEAYKWAYISARHGSQPEPIRLRDKLAKQLNVSQVQRAQKDGDEFLNIMSAALVAKQASNLQASNSAATTGKQGNDSSIQSKAAGVDCITGKSALEAFICLAPELREADQQMRQLFEDASGVFENAARERLINSQQAWRAIRDNSCSVTQADIVSTHLSSKKIDCLSGIYARRTEQLVAILESATIPDDAQESKRDESHPLSNSQPKINSPAFLSQSPPLNTASPRNEIPSPSTKDPLVERVQAQTQGQHAVPSAEIVDKKSDQAKALYNKIKGSWGGDSGCSAYFRIFLSDDYFGARYELMGARTYWRPKSISRIDLIDEKTINIVWGNGNYQQFEYIIKDHIRAKETLENGKFSNSSVFYMRCETDQKFIESELNASIESTKKIQ
ncbi:lysozyme inhibitor LprI family protein [Azospirillum sp.]|uniref:lysozyme inhibitor LprI family protein n=1 Tax=Azospirillum sp. TaxID=34012 RepID=UPI002D62A020|nr:lysozyme inhibitor LprI family protein [Azospirillum sp.]HYF86181.1 lysozyme inhibitor LprI family protein [Azospirillum sp.]